MQPNNGTGGGPQWANPDGTQQQQLQPGSNVTVEQHEQEFFAPLSTLDEPVKETIMRDVRSVASKLKVVLLPMDRTVCGVKIRVVFFAFKEVVDLQHKLLFCSHFSSPQIF
jgi:hypothetical protein